MYLANEIKKITDMNSIQDIGPDDMVIVQLNSGGTKKMFYSDLVKALIDSLDIFIKRTDVVDNLESDNSELPLSAKQGNILSGRDIEIGLKVYNAGDTVEEIENFYNNFSADMVGNFSIGTYYRAYVSHKYSYPPLGGGNWYLEGQKTHEEYEWQRAVSYNNALAFQRIKSGGRWFDWKRMLSVSDLNSTGVHFSTESRTKLVVTIKDFNSNGNYTLRLFGNSSSGATIDAVIGLNNGMIVVTTNGTVDVTVTQESSGSDKNIVINLRVYSSGYIMVSGTTGLITPIITYR